MGISGFSMVYMRNMSEAISSTASSRSMGRLLTAYFTCTRTISRQSSSMDRWMGGWMKEGTEEKAGDYQKALKYYMSLRGSNKFLRRKLLMATNA